MFLARSAAHRAGAACTGSLAVSQTTVLYARNLQLLFCAVDLQPYESIYKLVIEKFEGEVEPQEPLTAAVPWLRKSDCQEDRRTNDAAVLAPDPAASQPGPESCCAECALRALHAPPTVLQLMAWLMGQLTSGLELSDDGSRVFWRAHTQLSRSTFFLSRAPPAAAGTISHHFSALKNSVRPFSATKYYGRSIDTFYSRRLGP